jgi:flavin-dependent dehydrogenase
VAPAYSHDVVVVGAGPAGSTAALALARAGRSVVLLDRAMFPRPKICGNCLNPRTWKIWDRLGLSDSFRALPHCDLKGLDIQCEGRPVHRQDFRGAGPRAVARDVLDHWLLDHARDAGVEFLPATTVTGVDAGTGVVQSSAGEFRARLVLGADGRNSVVARHCGLMPPPCRCHRIAWQATLAAPAGLDRHVYLQVFEEGYFGYCRYSPDRAVVSLVLDARRSHDPAAAARPYLPAIPEQAWLRMNPITRAPARAGRDRVWLVGDAARVVEPFTGEGIAFALSTALLAADAALAGLAADRMAAALAIYTRRHRLLYARRTWVNALTRWLMSDPCRTTRIVRRVRPPGPLLAFLSHQVHAA